jgi:hypothetical protein
MPVNKSKWIFTLFRGCILDTHISVLSGNDPAYKNFTNQSITNNLYLNTLVGSVRVGDEKEINPIFIEKRNKAQLIAPLIIETISALYDRLLTQGLKEVGVEIHDTIAIEILNSDPENNQYSPGILEYATTLGMSPKEAYLELKLEYESFNSLKMRAYAVARKYQTIIREVTTQAEADALLIEIRQKLILETRI